MFPTERLPFFEICVFNNLLGVTQMVLQFAKRLPELLVQLNKMLLDVLHDR